MSVGHDRPWEYPDCPECESNVFVAGWNRDQHGNAYPSESLDYKCYLCGLAFDAEGGQEV